MLSDLVLACQQIEADIAAEEQRTGIFDRSDARYPILARSLNERHGNLKGTIATLEKSVSWRNPGSTQHSPIKPRVSCLWRACLRLCATIFWRGPQSPSFVTVIPG
ncbi:hypothetical protein [Bradyrhizobium ivorense]|uniref:hypothetical protein n=1 Tax=Bradyrhizobium ivorense TaxID=2511166 RepID=UPI001FCEBFA1|nr:hypothetical protein [Bradyrhizobium ivorense]